LWSVARSMQFIHTAITNTMEGEILRSNKKQRISLSLRNTLQADVFLQYSFDVLCDQVAIFEQAGIYPLFFQFLQKGCVVYQIHRRDQELGHVFNQKSEFNISDRTRKFDRKILLSETPI